MMTFSRKPFESSPHRQGGSQMKKCLKGITMFALLLIGHSAAQSKDDSVVKDFQERIAKYLEVHKAQGVSNKPSDSADKLADQKHKAAEKIRQTRPDAKQGDIFGPQISAYFKKQIAATLQGPDGAKVRASLRHAEPLPNVPLKVNEKYPPTLPLQSTPPTLLLNLPHLPNELHYRIVS